MSSAKQKLVLKTLKSHNTIWHPDSGLVFKSQKERLVIGRLENDDIIADEHVIEINNDYNFILDPTVFSSEDDEESDDVSKNEEKMDEEKMDEEKNDEEHLQSDTIETEVKNDSEVTNKNDTNNVCDLIEKNHSIILEHIKALTLENENLKKSLDLSNTERESVVSERDSLKKKFDTMKSLFN